jgi:hypothetical protein
VCLCSRVCANCFSLTVSQIRKGSSSIIAGIAAVARVAYIIRIMPLVQYGPRQVLSSSDIIAGLCP